MNYKNIQFCFSKAKLFENWSIWFAVQKLGTPKVQKVMISKAVSKLKKMRFLFVWALINSLKQ